MHVTSQWQEKVRFSASTGAHSVLMDTKAPIGTDQAMSPKQLLLAAICGCTGMDVVSWFRKGHATAASVTIDASAELTSGQPSVFKEVKLVYRIAGEVPAALAVEAVEKSMTLYCGVSAMIVKACPITYDIELNGTFIASGTARF